MATSQKSAIGRTHHPEDGTDDEQNDSDEPQKVDSEDEAQYEQYNSKNNQNVTSYSVELSPTGTRMRQGLVPSGRGTARPSRSR